jgi:oxygen-independent coproporphyrinogen-3 oxidase
VIFIFDFDEEEEMVMAIAKELQMRKSDLKRNKLRLYFGGGTPSVLILKKLIF